MTEAGNDIRAQVSGSLITAREDLTMYRIRFILTGAVVGIAWAYSLRGFMQQLAGADWTFTFAGTFGVIIPAGTVVGALLGWAEYQRRASRQHRLFILAPLLIGIIPVVLTAQLDMGPIGLALLGLIGGYSVSGRGWPWVRIVAGIIALAVIPITFLAPKPSPDLKRHDDARRLVLHPGRVFVRVPRPGVLDTYAPACSQPQRGWPNARRP